MRFTPTVALVSVLLPTLSLAGRKDRAGKQGMLMPDLSKVLGDAWTVPPELSDRARPGSVLELTEAGLRVVMPDCVATAPSESSLTNVSMQNSLSGGVGWGGSRVGASASAEHTMKLAFQGPTVQGFYLIDFVPSQACVSKLTAYAERGGDLSKLVVVQEALLARVSGCEQSTASAGVSGPGGGASLSGAGACQMFSDAPVAVGLKTVALSDIRELSGIGGTAPAAASTPPPAAPAPADGASRGKAGIEWVPLPAGAFEMGSNTGNDNETPIHTVRVPAFELTRTEVTVGQYRQCVDAGVCTQPKDSTADGRCNWGRSGREDHPVNCVDLDQARAFAAWAGGRLPTEAEFEYAARSGGRTWMYPWGNEAPSCRLAVMDDGGDGCGEDRTWPVCSKPDGNSAQGVCDLAGNVWEWTADALHSNYDGAPDDGSAWTGDTIFHAIRGGSYVHDGEAQRAAQRFGYVPRSRDADCGFRLAR